MRVLQVITTLETGGAERLIVDSVPLYQKKGIATDVMVLSTSDTAFKEELQNASSGHVFFLTRGSVYNPLLIFKIIPYLRNYDLVHAHLFPVLYWIVLAKLISFSKIPIVYTEHSTYNRRRSIRIMKPFERFIYSRISYLGCISDGVYQNLISFIKRQDDISVINNGVDIEKFKRGNVDSIGSFFSKDDKIVIQVSSFRSQKDQQTLIRALDILPSWIKLVLVGDGPDLDKSKKLVSDLSLTERVFFLGKRFDVPDLLKKSDIVVLSSNFEGFGLAIVEGMAAGKPVIASNIDGLNEIVEGYGILFRRGNFAELADHILDIFENPALYRRLSMKSINRAGDFSIDVMVDKYIYIYRNLIKRRKNA